MADPAGRDPVGAHGVVGVVLAAGAGRRFGGPKALIRFEGKLLVERAVDTLMAGGCSDVVVVLGAQAAEVRLQASLDGAQVVVNEQWDDGMSTSLRCGLSACARAQAAVITLVDQPGVTPEVVRRLLEAWSAGDRPVVVATYEGEARHPVLFGAEVWDAVMASVRGDSGARAWLRENPALIEHVEVADIGDCADIDTPEDLSTR